MSRPDPLDQQVIAEFRARGGIVGAMSNLSLLLLHHVGAKSASERVTPLAYWPVSADSVAVLASNRGAPTHPHWYHNLIANPMTTAEIGTDTWAIHARVADAERRRILTKCDHGAEPAGRSRGQTHVAGDPRGHARAARKAR